MRLIWPDGSSEVPLMKARNTRMVQKPSDHPANISFHLTAQPSFHSCADPIKSSCPISCPVRFKEGSLIKLLINRPEQQRQELTHVLLGVGLFFEFQNSLTFTSESDSQKSQHLLPLLGYRRASTCTSARPSWPCMPAGAWAWAPRGTRTVG